MANKILLVGDGGHCKSIIDSLLKLNIYDDIGIISKEQKNLNYFGVRCIGTDEDLLSLFNNGWDKAFVSVGSIGDNSNRERILTNLINIGFSIPNIIDRTAIISNNCKIGIGNFIGKGAIINVDVEIGSYCIVNTGSVIEHECKIGDFTHISSNSTLCGNVVIEAGAHIGAGSVIKQGITIGENATIGIGSVVTKDVKNNVIAYGNPCKVIEVK